MDGNHNPLMAGGFHHTAHAVSPSIELYEAHGGKDYESDFPFFKVLQV